jgi:hypothetical protein
MSDIGITIPLHLIIGVYLILHLPAIILLIVGLVRRNRKKKNAKIFLIIAGIYFIIGAGVCGMILLG